MSRIAPTFPNTQNTSNSISVATASGFNQGDLVYYSNGDYKSPANITAPSTVNFPQVQNQLTTSAGVGNTVTPLFSNSDFYTSDNTGSSDGQAMAVLTNGNIVQVFRSYPTYYPSFRIVNSSGTVVVSTTAIATSSPFLSGSTSLSVCALSGGGFAVLFATTANNPAYAVYSNAGTLVTAATSDPLPAGNINIYTNFYLIPLANGGFVAATMNTVYTYYIKIYTATGGTTATWFNPFSGTGGTNSFSLSPRSDNSFCFLAWNNATSTQNYAIYNASGTAIVSPTSITGANNQSPSSVSTLSDGTTFVLCYLGSSSTNLYLRLLPTGNTLGSAITVYTNSSNNTYFNLMPSYGLRVIGLSNGGIGIAFLTNQNLYFIFANSTATTFYPTSNAGGAVPVLVSNYYNRNQAAYGWYSSHTVYENGGNLYFYASSGQYGLNMWGCSINISTYLLNPSPYSTSTSSFGPNTVSQQPGSIALSAVTPSKFSYYASSTTSTTLAQPVSTVLASQIITSTYSYGLTSTTLSDGRFAIAFINGSGVITVNVYSPAGALLTTLSPGTSAATGTYFSAVKIFPLASGKLGVVWPTSATTLVASIYSSTYTALYSAVTLVTNGSNLTSEAGNYGWTAEGNIISDRFGIFYNSTSVVGTGVIFNNTATQVVTFTFGSSGNVKYAWNCATNAAGFWFISYYDSSNGTQYWYSYYPNASAGYQQLLNASGGSAAISPSIKIVPSGNYLLMNYNNGGFIYSYIYNPDTSGGANATSYNTNTQLSITPSNGYNALGLTGYGSLTFVDGVTANSATGSFNVYGLTPYTPGSSFTYGSWTIPSTNILSFSASLSSYPCFNITPGPGYSSVITYLDINNYPNFMIVSTLPLLTFTSLTAGSSVSNPVPVSPATQTTSPSISNAVLVGVSNTTASAGSSASITINGPASLNSSYPTTTSQAFDNQIPNGTAIQGVKGLISGRNLTLFGNN